MAVTHHHFPFALLYSSGPPGGVLDPFPDVFERPIFAYQAPERQWPRRVESRQPTEPPSPREFGVSSNTFFDKTQPAFVFRPAIADGRTPAALNPKGDTDHEHDRRPPSRPISESSPKSDPEPLAQTSFKTKQASTARGNEGKTTLKSARTWVAPFGADARNRETGPSPVYYAGARGRPPRSPSAPEWHSKSTQRPKFLRIANYARAKYGRPGLMGERPRRTRAHIADGHPPQRTGGPPASTWPFQRPPRPGGQWPTTVTRTPHHPYPTVSNCRNRLGSWPGDPLPFLAGPARTLLRGTLDGALQTTSGCPAPQFSGRPPSVDPDLSHGPISSSRGHPRVPEETKWGRAPAYTGLE